MSDERKLLAGVLTLSDSRSEVDDESGKALKELLEKDGYEIVRYLVIPDDEEKIRDLLISWSAEGLDLILTTGGTGPGPRDKTPEATSLVIEKEMPGFAELMRHEGSKKTKRAYLTRGICGIRGRTIIINLPGSIKGATESFEAVADLVPHTVKMMEGGGH